MSKNLIPLFTGSGTIDDFRIRAALLFDEIEEQHGSEVAADIFQTTTPSQREINERKRNHVLSRYESSMKSVKQLARQLAEENNTLPPEQRYAYGSTDIQTLERYIWRLLRARREHLPEPLSRLLEDTAREFEGDGDDKPDKGG